MSDKHKHLWERPLAVREDYQVVNGVAVPTGPLVQGSFECTCGKSAWLTDGRLASLERFPRADMLTRLLALSSKLKTEGEAAMTAEDRDELQAITEEMLVAVERFKTALASLGEAFTIVLSDFADHINSLVLGELSEAGKIFSGETPEFAPEVTLVSTEGLVDSGSVSLTGIGGVVFSHAPAQQSFQQQIATRSRDLA